MEWCLPGKIPEKGPGGKNFWDRPHAGGVPEPAGPGAGIGQSDPASFAAPCGGSPVNPGGGRPKRPRGGGAQRPSRPRYLLFHKPYGVICQFTDPEGRPCLKDFVPVDGVYAAGRLDWDSEGLLLLTDDGPLIHRLSVPRPPSSPRPTGCRWKASRTRRALEALRRGVVLEGRRTLPAGAEPFPEGAAFPPRSVPIRVRKNIPTAWITLRLVEGRNRQVRRMTAAVGHPTLRLIREAIGPFALEGLAPGGWRELAPAEVRTLLPF